MSRILPTSDAILYYEKMDRDRPSSPLTGVGEMYQAYATLRDLPARPHTQAFPHGAAHATLDNRLPDGRDPQA